MPNEIRINRMDTFKIIQTQNNAKCELENMVNVYLQIIIITDITLLSHKFGYVLASNASASGWM